MRAKESTRIKISHSEAIDDIDEMVCSKRKFGYRTYYIQSDVPSLQTDINKITEWKHKKCNISQ